MKLLTLIAFASALSIAAPPPILKDAQKTVDAITGTRRGRMTAIVPGYAPETFPWTIVCKPVALHIRRGLHHDGKDLDR